MILRSVAYPPKYLVHTDEILQILHAPLPVPA